MNTVLPFTQIDVFTDRFLFGNPVAVVHDADGLADEQLAAFARWTNLSETTFLLSATDPAADYRLRIFTTRRNCPSPDTRRWARPGRGSPQAGVRASTGEVVQQCGAGLVRIRRDGNRLAFAAPPLLRGGPVAPDDVADVAREIGVEPAEVVDSQWADNGPGWVALLLPDAQRVLSLSPDPSNFGRFPDIGVVGPYPAGSATAFEVRAFMALDAGWEDPVTGSLNAALAQWLIPAGYAPDSYVAAQGTRLGRRGRVHVHRDGAQIWVGGDTVVGITGHVELG